METKNKFPVIFKKYLKNLVLMLKNAAKDQDI